MKKWNPAHGSPEFRGAIPPPNQTPVILTARPNAAGNTSFGCAPRATRIPSSRSRLLTEYAAIPKMPVMESIAPIAPSTPSETVAICAGNSCPPISSSAFQSQPAALHLVDAACPFSRVQLSRIFRNELIDGLNLEGVLLIIYASRTYGNSASDPILSIKTQGLRIRVKPVCPVRLPGTTRLKCQAENRWLPIARLRGLVVWIIIAANAQLLRRLNLHRPVV
jgi:hypothetical protein